MVLEPHQDREAPIKKNEKGKWVLQLGTGSSEALVVSVSKTAHIWPRKKTQSWQVEAKCGILGGGHSALSMSLRFLVFGDEGS